MILGLFGYLHKFSVRKIRDRPCNYYGGEKEGVGQEIFPKNKFLPEKIFIMRINAIIHEKIFSPRILNRYKTLCKLPLPHKNQMVRPYHRYIQIITSS